MKIGAFQSIPIHAQTRQKPPPAATVNLPRPEPVRHSMPVTTSIPAPPISIPTQSIAVSNPAPQQQAPFLSNLAPLQKASAPFNAANPSINLALSNMLAQRNPLHQQMPAPMIPFASSFGFHQPPQSLSKEGRPKILTPQNFHLHYGEAYCSECKYIHWNGKSGRKPHARNCKSKTTEIRNRKTQA